MPMSFDMKLEDLKMYKPKQTKREDFKLYWENTLNVSRTIVLNAEITQVEYPIDEVKVFDVFYDGFDGNRVNGWFILPAAASKDNKVPVMITFPGYTCNKGTVQDFMKWLIQGYAVFSVDVRGQGGLTPDNARYSQGSSYGWMTKGILDKHEYYYRNIYTDSVRAIDFVCGRDEIDINKIGLVGGSQGGGITIALAALDKRPKLAMAVYPFLSHFDRAYELAGGPYEEIFNYFKKFDPEMINADKVFETLSYFDGMNFASQIECPTLMAIGLMDVICPPSTTFAVYNHLNCYKELKVYPQYGHEAIPLHDEEMIKFAKKYMK